MKFHNSLIFLLLFAAAVNGQSGKLFLIAGQSNAVGQGTSTLSPVCTPGTAFEYNILTNSLQHLQDPMGQTWNNFEPAGTGSIGPSFAKILNALINEPIYIVSTSRGGSSCSLKGELATGTWDETGNKPLFTYAVNKVKAAVKATGFPLSGIIWIQGERDANAIRTLNETEAEYQIALEKLIARFRAQFGSNLPFYIVLTGLQGVLTNGVTIATETQSNYAVRRIQMEVAKKTPNVFVAYTSTDTFFDKGWMKPEAGVVHYLQPAYNQIGDSVAQFVAKIPFNPITGNVPIPTPNSINSQFVIDNMDAACTFDIPWAKSTSAKGFYGSNYMQDGSTTADPDKWAKWTPNIPTSGKYRVYMQWTEGVGRPTIAPVEIQSADSISHFTINQAINGGMWNYLGMYNFYQGNTGYVKLLASAVGATIADAVLFEQIKLETNLKNLTETNDILSVKAESGSDNIQIRLKLNSQSKVSLALYSIIGTKIGQILDNKNLDAAEHTFSVNFKKNSTAIYLAKLKIENSPTITQKFIVNR